MALLGHEKIRPLGVQLKRAATLFGIAQAFNEGRLQLDKVLAIVQGVKALAAASCIAMRTWCWPDVSLTGNDLPKQRFPGMTPSQIADCAECDAHSVLTPRCTNGITTAGRR